MAETYKGMNDVVAWGEKDQRGAYVSGASMVVAGRVVVLDALPDRIGGGKPAKRKPPAKR